MSPGRAGAEDMDRLTGYRTVNVPVMPFLAWPGPGTDTGRCQG